MRSTPGAIFAKRAVSQHMKFAANHFAMQLGAGTQTLVERKELLFVNQPIIVGVVIDISKGIISSAFFICPVRIVILVHPFEGPFGGREGISGYG